MGWLESEMTINSHNANAYEDRVENLKGWLSGLIDEFRKSCCEHDLYENARRLTYDFRACCQIEVFWLSGPEYQIIVLTRDADRPDKEIIVNGPYEVHEIVGRLEKRLKESRWTRQMPADAMPWWSSKQESNGVTYAEMLEPIIKKYLLKIKEGLYYAITREITDTEELSRGEYCWLIPGDASELDYKRVVEYFHSINDHNITFLAQRGQRQLEELPDERDNLNELSGYATAFYPPMWIGQKVERSFVERMTGDQTLPSMVFDSTFDDKMIVAHSDGFIGIECRNNAHAVRVLNVIFGAFSLSGIPCFGITEADLAEIGINSGSLHVSIRSRPIRTLRTSLVQSIVKLSDYHDSRVVTLADFEEIVRRADDVIRDKELSDQLIFLTEAYTHFYNSEFNQAFIIGWIILEKFIGRLWKALLKEGGIEKEGRSKKRFEKLNSPPYGTDSWLEILSINGKIDKDTLKLLMSLKKARNKFVHEGKAIDSATVKKLLLFASLTLRASSRGIFPVEAE